MLENYLVTIVCAFGSATFATCVQQDRRAAAFVLGWVPAVSLVLADRTLGTAAIGMLAALWSGLVLAPPTRGALAALGSGAVAATGAGLLAGLGAANAAAAGAPALSAVAAFLLVPAFAGALGHRRPGFAPARMREEALLVVLALGAITAALPMVADGWRTAAALSIGGDEWRSTAALSIGEAAAAPQPPPVWTAWIAFGALGAGMLASLWRRR